jgi:hypothetical protein
MSKLPTKPSAAIRLALADLRKVEEDPSYTVRMDWWHWPISEGVCAVCLAGAVMAKTLGAPRDDIGPSRLASMGVIAPYERDVLVSLDSFRCGFVEQGLSEFYRRTIETSVHVTPPQYEKDPEGFHAAMNELADALEKEGH